jgi:succinate dehydrogenase / fumarate reductase, cytochrome b subunit
MSTTAEPKPSVVDRLNLSWALRLLKSSIGRKAVMAATGLLLCGFLVTHLAGNLKLYNGRTAFDDYAHWLHDQEFLPLAEVGLLVLFVLHIYLAFVTTFENRQARQQAYAVKETKRRDGVLYTWNWMFISGAVILGFLILHLVDMRFGLRPDLKYADEAEAFRNTIAVLSSPISRIVYMVGSIFLGFHLAHGFQSAFQSLGLNHPKYTPTIKLIGILFAIVIAAGFFSLPLIVPSMPDIVQQAVETPPSPIERHP